MCGYYGIGRIAAQKVASAPDLVVELTEEAELKLLVDNFDLFFEDTILLILIGAVRPSESPVSRSLTGHKELPAFL